MNFYTVLCRDLEDPVSTTYIESVEAETPQAAALAVRKSCMAAWEYSDSEVAVIGVLAGEVAVVDWCDDGIDLPEAERGMPGENDECASCGKPVEVETELVCASCRE